MHEHIRNTEKRCSKTKLAKLNAYEKKNCFTSNMSSSD